MRIRNSSAVNFIYISIVFGLLLFFLSLLSPFSFYRFLASCSLRRWFFAAFVCVCLAPMCLICTCGERIHATHDTIVVDGIVVVLTMQTHRTNRWNGRSVQGEPCDINPDCENHEEYLCEFKSMLMTKLRNFIDNDVANDPDCIKGRKKTVQVSETRAHSNVYPLLFRVRVHGTTRQQS